MANALYYIQQPDSGQQYQDIAIDIPTGRVYIGTTTGLSIFDSGYYASSNLADMAPIQSVMLAMGGIC